MNWPLGINPEMDRHAVKNGLPHWNCTSPKSNEFWIRCDGRVHQAEFHLPGGYPTELREIDQRFPICDNVFRTEKI